MNRPKLHRRGFTLIEVVVVILVLALAVPPAVLFMDHATARRADAINQMRASAYATLVMETVLADVASTNSSLGYAALASSSTYLNTATTGLTDRIATLATPYSSLGMSYSVTIGGEVSSSGSASATATDNVFRQITVTVTYPSATQTSASLSLSSLVSEL